LTFKKEPGESMSIGIWVVFVTTLLGQAFGSPRFGPPVHSLRVETETFNRRSARGKCVAQIKKQFSEFFKQKVMPLPANCNKRKK
jgi:hypothetical protein